MATLEVLETLEREGVVLLPVRVLSRIFRGKFLAFLRTAFRKGQIQFHGRLVALDFDALLNRAFGCEWVVYTKPPFGGPEQVLPYLANYTHRVAISNHRILSIEDGNVTFRWKDYAHGNKNKKMTLTACEFLRRFFLHVLPPSFVRIRHFGFLANRQRKALLNICLHLLHAQLLHSFVEPDASARIEVPLCPACHTGHLHIVERIPSQLTSRVQIDSS